MKNRVLSLIMILAVITSMFAVSSPKTLPPQLAKAATILQAKALPVVYVPINITNTQSVATPSPFQVMIDIDSTEYAGYEAADLSNIAFTYRNGTVIPSWLESGNSNSSTNTLYWLKIGSIPAEHSMTVFMDFYPVTDDVLSNLTSGEAPSLSPMYGEYDDGANVFILYGDFNNSLRGWQASAFQGSFMPVPSSSGVEMLDGKNAESGTEATYLTLPIELPSTPIIVEEAWDYNGGGTRYGIGAAANAMSIGPSPFETSNVLIASEFDAPVLNNSASVVFNYGTSPYTGLYDFTTGSQVGSSSFTGPGSFSVISFLETNGTWASAGYSTQYISLEDFGSALVPAVVSGHVSNVLYNPAVVISAPATVNISPTYEYVRWAIARAFPPNGVAPSVTVGNVSIPGDLNGDGKVSLQDLVILANAYGSKPGDTKWNPNADINGDNIVGLSDLVILAQHYGQHYP